MVVGVYGGKPSEDGGVKQDTTALECHPGRIEVRGNCEEREKRVEVRAQSKKKASPANGPKAVRRTG